MKKITCNWVKFLIIYIEKDYGIIKNIDLWGGKEKEE